MHAFITISKLEIENENITKSHAHAISKREPLETFYQIPSKIHYKFSCHAYIASYARNNDLQMLYIS